MKSRTWIPYVAGAAAFLITLIAGGLVGTNWLASNIEMDRLIIAIEKSEAAMGTVQDRVEVIFDDLDGEIPGDGPQTEETEPGNPPTDAETAAAVAELAAIAVDGQAAISEAAREIASLNILPWHTEIIEAREAYLLHNYAWQAYMQSAQEDPVAFATPQPLVNQTFMDAEEPLVRAVPEPPLFDLPARVQAIFEEGAPETTGDVI